MLTGGGARRLTLRREPLAQLSPEELAWVDGGARAAAATIPALCFVYDPTRLRCLQTLDCT